LDEVDWNTDRGLISLLIYFYKLKKVKYLLLWENIKLGALKLIKANILLNQSIMF